MATFLDDCISALFEPGAIPASSGVVPQDIYRPTTDGIGKLIDCPLLRRSDDEVAAAFIYYCAAMGISVDSYGYGGEFWASYQLEGPEAMFLFHGEGTGVQYGTLADTPDIPDNPFRTDYNGSFKVTPVAGPSFNNLPNNVSYSNMLAGISRVAIGRHNRWVIAHYTNVAQSGADYLFNGGILWGAYGSENYLSQLQVGDDFVFLGNLSLIGKGRWKIDGIDLAGYYEGRRIGGRAVSQTIYSASGRDKFPPAPVNLNASVSGNDIVLTWDGRSRFRWHDGTGWIIEESDPPNRFVIEILGYEGGGVVHSWSSVEANTVTYANADIISDFGSIPSEIIFRVYKIGNYIGGRGFGAEKTVIL